MMRLLGLIFRDNKELFLLQDKNKFVLEEANGDDFKNYQLIKNRDKIVGNLPKEGPGVFKFRYGPVKAGVIEAGVFNVYTYGERILSVEIDPKYKRRNIEKLMEGKTLGDALRLSEKICGNFAFSHSLAFSRALESIIGIEVSEVTSRLRIIAIELERMYNHVHVIANLSKGASQTVLTSHLNWIFEECLRLNGEFSGDRFLRGINRIGGIETNLTNLDDIKNRVDLIKNKFEDLYLHSLKSWNFIDRLYKTAPLSSERALEIGITGPSLRASGIECDLRAFDNFYDDFKIISREDGDALARMEVRSLEFIESCNIILSQINFIGSVKGNEEKTFENDIDGNGIGYAESPSGIVAYFVSLKGGRVEYVYASTPSLFGFKAFADTLEGFIFTDFSFAFDSYGVNFADLAR